jgi:hypothetical protein
MPSLLDKLAKGWGRIGIGAAFTTSIRSNERESGGRSGSPQLSCTMIRLR